MVNKLIEIAAKYEQGKRRIYTKEQIELALAWLEGEVGHRGVCEAIGTKGSDTYNFLSVALRKAYIDGLLIVKKRKSSL